jgi:hypothetical protein
VASNKGTIHLGTVKGGKFRPDNARTFRESFFGYEGKRVQITVSAVKKRRSLRQNAYYWAVIVPMLGNHLGYTTEQMHEALKAEHLSERDPNTGLLRIRSTSDLPTTEFEAYCSRLRQWASEFFSLYIPDPNEFVFEGNTCYYKADREGR